MSVRREESKPYMKDRRLIQREGYVVIFSDETTMPLCCPVCETVFRTRLDEEEYKRLECCAICAKAWAYPNIERWKNGWRPTSDEVKSQPKNVVDFIFKID